MNGNRFFVGLSFLLVFCRGFSGELQTFHNVTLVPESWADGDSFRVRFEDGRTFTLRLYGADCVELHVRDSSDARRLRAQRRYFGISGHGDTAESSIGLAKRMGDEAAKEVIRQLASPFTVHTAFADGRGDARFSRIYAFVTTAEGRDLATELVSLGLARAYGVARSTADGQTRDEYRETLRDAELVAARHARGIWSHTDWETLSDERREERLEEREERAAMGTALPTEVIDINTASRDELMRIPGIGEVTAAAIIEDRPYTRVEDLIRVRGIGHKTLENLQAWVTVSP